MGSKFISNGLASAKRTMAAAKTEPAAMPVSPAPAVPPANLGEIVRREDAKLHGDLLVKERAEFHKHRQELLPELRETIVGHQAALRSLEDQLETLIRAHQDLEAAELSTDGPVSLGELREAKRNLEAARMELMKLQRQQAAAAPATPPAAQAPGTAAVVLPDLSWKQAAVLGLSLTWPVAVVIFLGALFVGICLLSVFKT